MNFIPENLAKKTYICEKCQSKNHIDWLKDRGGELNSFHHKAGGIMVRLSLGENCPHCNHVNLIQLPVIKKKNNFYLFGDEAIRDIDTDARLFSYSIVGCSKKFLEEIENDLREIKRKFLPNENPDNWRIHMKDLWSGHNRNRHDLFKDKTQDDVKMLLGNIKRLFDKHGKKLYKTNISIAGGLNKDVGKIKKLEDSLKVEAYTLITLETINQVTFNACEPHFFFDAEKDSTKMDDAAGHIIQKWASDAFTKGSQNMLYCFMTHSIPVNPPKFVKPGSKPLLELADILCFVTARHIDKTYKNEKVDVDSTMFGEVMYYTFSEKGQFLISELSKKFPWKLFR